MCGGASTPPRGILRSSSRRRARFRPTRAPRSSAGSWTRLATMAATTGSFPRRGARVLGGGLRPPSDGHRAPDGALLPATARKDCAGEARARTRSKEGAGRNVRRALDEEAGLALRPAPLVSHPPVRAPAPPAQSVSSWGRLRRGPSRPPPSDLPADRLGGTVRVAALAAAATTWPAAARTPTAAGAPAAAGPRGLRVGDLHGDAPAVELTPVELGARVLGLSGRVHLDEAKAARLSGEAVGDDGCGEDVTALGEELPKSFAGGGVGEPADVELGRHEIPPPRLSSATAPVSRPANGREVPRRRGPACDGGRFNLTRAARARKRTA